jgi:hypothetical protein
VSAESDSLIHPDSANEGISLHFACKQPGTGFAVQEVKMDFSLRATFDKRSPEADERLLLDALRGDPALSLVLMKSRPPGVRFGDSGGMVELPKPASRITSRDSRSGRSESSFQFDPDTPPVRQNGAATRGSSSR